MMDELEELRNRISEVDAGMAKLFADRMELCGRIAALKSREGIPIYDPEQEARVLTRHRGLITDARGRRYYDDLMRTILSISKDYQGELTGRIPGVVLERGSISRAALHLADIGKGTRLMVITGAGVPGQYAAKAAGSLRSAGFEVTTLTIEDGELSKGIDTVSYILCKLLDNNYTRGDMIVAVGGGTIGDICGFAASCYMRGIRYVNIPTTLLAMVDSSIGGKTGVNFSGVKNAVGAFHSPYRVIIDPEALNTLSPRLVSEGMAEIIKMAATSDKELFRELEDGNQDIGYLIGRALGIKSDIVRRDPLEKGLRRVLNFGHTIGHAIEAASSGALYHGECVAIGMMYMSGGDARRRIGELLLKYGLPLTHDVDTQLLLQYLVHDKKSVRDGITTVWVSEIGSHELRKCTIGEIGRIIERPRSG